MKVVAFIEPPQGKVVEKILRHCGLWQALSARAPPEVEDLVTDRKIDFQPSIQVRIANSRECGVQRRPWPPLHAALPSRFWPGWVKLGPT